jgi:DNA-binding transcriptional regulator YhcF (GntR family)
MEWKFTGDKPVYQQIMEQLRSAILAGEYAPGDRIPSVRELAMQAKVNPNTMQRALTELEEEQVLVNLGTTGRCVTDDQQILEQLRSQIIDQTVRHCAQQFSALGLTMQEAAKLLQELEEKEEA